MTMRVTGIGPYTQLMLRETLRENSYGKWMHPSLSELAPYKNHWG